MKILVIEDGSEDLSEFSYLYKRDVYRRKNVYYKFVSSCEVCGDSFFMRLSYPTIVCSNSCRSKISMTPEKIERFKKDVAIKMKAGLIKGNDRGGVTAKNLPLFKTYAHQLSLVEEVRECGTLLECRCSLCNEWFIPKKSNVERRSQYIKGNSNRESRLYCSEECKHLCPIFNKHTHPAGHNPRKHRNRTDVTESELRVWSKTVLARHDFICEYCGETANTAHHIIPKKLAPFYALDPDNGISRCEECHYKYGHTSEECQPVYIAKVVCST